MHHGMMRKANERLPQPGLRVQPNEVERVSQAEESISTATFAEVQADLRQFTHQLAWAIHYAVQQKQEASTLQGFALTDQLTGLHSQRGFLLLAKQQLRFSQRTNRSDLLILVAVRSLKCPNESYGSDADNHLLKQATSVLRKTFRRSDIIARLGPNRLIVLAIGAAEQSAESISARLQENLKTHNEKPTESQCALSLSFGFAPLKARSSFAEDL